MVEYGHIAAGAAKSASGMRKASPAATFRRLGDVAGNAGSTESRHGMRVSASGPIRTVRPQTVHAQVEPVRVIEVRWGEPRKALSSPETRTSQENVVLAGAGSPSELEAAPDLDERGLSIGMSVTEVSKILGDPSIRTSGLGGRTYDEKLFYPLSDGWRVAVYAARGRVTALVPARTEKKTPHGVLRAADSVLP